MRETEEKLRTMEKSKFDEFKASLARQLEETERAKQQEYDRRMREIEHERQV